jgi:hypothetical protein
MHQRRMADTINKTIVVRLDNSLLVNGQVAAVSRLVACMFNGKAKNSWAVSFRGSRMIF